MNTLESMIKIQSFKTCNEKTTQH